MQRSIADWGGNLGAFALTILMNVLANALPINGQTTGAISDKYPSLFTPAGFTFGIWAVIYLALLAFVIWQALPAQRNDSRLAEISTLFKVSCVANAVWIVVWHYDLLALSLLVMLVILIALILVYRRLIAIIDSATFFEHLVLYTPFSLYTGWISLATIANVSALQTGNGWDNVGIAAVQWTLVKLALAGAIGATMVLRYRDVVFVLVVAWAAWGISVAQASTPAVAGAAMTLSMVALLLVLRDGIVRLRD